MLLNSKSVSVFALSMDEHADTVKVFRADGQFWRNCPPSVIRSLADASLITGKGSCNRLKSCYFMDSEDPDIQVAKVMREASVKGRLVNSEASHTVENEFGTTYRHVRNQWFSPGSMALYV